MTKEEAIKILNKCRDRGFERTSYTLEEYHTARDMAIKALEQEPKTGHWKSFTHSAYHGIDDDGELIWREVKVYHCNLCNRRTVIKENYCPNCGAKMESEE